MSWWVVPSVWPQGVGEEVSGGRELRRTEERASMRPVYEARGARAQIKTVSCGVVSVRFVGELRSIKP